MDSIHEVKEALSARSRTATLDELQNEGRRKVRIIRAEHIAEMIAQAVQRAVQETGLIPQSEVDALVERSKAEFKDVVREREEERAEMDQLRDRLDSARSEAEGLRDEVERLRGASEQVEILAAERDALGRELADLSGMRGEMEHAQGETERLKGELGRAQQDIERLREELGHAVAQLEQAQAELAEATAQPAPSIGSGPSLAELERVSKLEEKNESLQQALAAAMARTESLAAEMESLRTTRERRHEPPATASNDMMMKLLEQVIALKTQPQGTQPAQAAAPAAAPALPEGADLQAMMAQLTGALNDRLDKFGRKMGISSAVEAQEVKFDSLFKDDDSAIETNMDDVVVKQKKGGGIGANLERLKKLKGGG